LSGDCTKEGGSVKGRRSIEDRSAKGAITTSKSSSRARRETRDARDARRKNARRETRDARRETQDARAIYGKSSKRGQKGDSGRVDNFLFRNAPLVGLHGRSTLQRNCVGFLVGSKIVILGAIIPRLTLETPKSNET
jgi:hypothetical protein